MQRTYVNSTDVRFQIGHATDTDNSGRQNGDAYLIFPSPHQPELLVRSQPTWYMLLADGQGNDRRSHVASQIAVESAYHALIQSPGADAEMPHTLTAALNEANREIRRLAADDPELHGMSTSLLAAAIHHGRLYLVNAGHGVAYLARNGAFHRLTLAPQRAAPNSARQPLLGDADDIGLACLLADWAEEETHDAEQGRFNGHMGGQAVADSLLLQPDDRIVLCSEDLARVLAQDEMLAVINHYPPETAAEQLVQMARQHQGVENGTSVVLQWNDVPPSPSPTPRAQRHGVLLFAASLLAVIGIWLVLSLSWQVSAQWAQRREASANDVAVNVVAGDNGVAGDDMAVEQRATPAATMPTPLSDTAAGQEESAIGANAASPTLASPSTEQHETQPTSAGASDQEREVPQPEPTAQSTPGADPARPTTAPRANTSSVEIREHWNTFLQRATPVGEAAEATSVAPTSEPTPTPTATVIATSTAIATDTADGNAPTPTVEQSTIAPTPTISPTLEVYILQPNDNLWSIATARGLTVEDLLAVNPQISDKDQILNTGDPIYIPQTDPASIE